MSGPAGERSSPSLLDPGAFVPVAVTQRCGYDESIHHGAVVALAGDGSLAWAAGDADIPIYARSSSKPLQAEAMIAAGLAVDADLLAVVCASHDGRAEHLDAVRRLLRDAGLSVHDLQNTPAFPIEEAAHDAALRGGIGPSALLQNCSGKHAGMLATAVVNGWPTAGYLEAEHPVQSLIAAHLAGVAGPVAHVGVDGCGAPAAVVGLRALTGAVRDVAVRRGPVQQAMTAHPGLVGGPRRDVTALMKLVDGLVAKDGAEGVFVAAVPDGRAVGVKIADGASRACGPVVVAALRSLGIDVPAGALAHHILGHGRPVGDVRAIVCQG